MMGGIARIICALVLFAAAAGVPSAGSAAFIGVADLRSIGACTGTLPAPPGFEGCITGAAEARPSALFAFFDESAASIYSITFDVDVATPFSLSGVLQRRGPYSGRASVSLTDLTLRTQVF